MPSIKCVLLDFKLLRVVGTGVAPFRLSVVALPTLVATVSLDLAEAMLRVSSWRPPPRGFVSTLRSEYLRLLSNGWWWSLDVGDSFNETALRMEFWLPDLFVCVNVRPPIELGARVELASSWDFDGSLPADGMSRYSYMLSRERNGYWFWMTPLPLSMPWTELAKWSSSAGSMKMSPS